MMARYNIQYVVTSTMDIMSNGYSWDRLCVDAIVGVYEVGSSRLW